MEKILCLLPVTESQRKLLENSIPEGSELTFRNKREVTREEIQEATILIGNPAKASDVKDSPNLKWIQLNSAGADAFLKEGILPEGTILTNATGAYGLAISEHMLGQLLMLKKKLYLYEANQRNQSWHDEGNVTSVWGARVLVLGFGDIGMSFGRLCSAMGATVIGVRRTAYDCPEFAEKVVTYDKLDMEIANADVIAMSLPGTKETYHIMNRERFARMKKDAILLNVGRGTAIDQEALFEALTEGKIAGAAVDVTDPEPLPADSPLWDCPNLLITPHISGMYHLPETLERIVKIAADNLRAYGEGRELKNQVDFSTGYRKR